MKTNNIIIDNNEIIITVNYTVAINHFNNYVTYDYKVLSYIKKDLERTEISVKNMLNSIIEELNNTNTVKDNNYELYSASYVVYKPNKGLSDYIKI